MGGSSKSAAPAAATPAATTRPTMTMQPAMPGQLDALSAQLAAGYGQSQPDILALLNQYYRPMEIPDYSPQPTPAAATTPRPAATTPAKTSVPSVGMRRDPNGGINR